jgi:endoglucanase
MAQTGVSEQIRLNQIGFYPNESKLAIVVNSEAKKFFILEAEKKDTVFKGTLVKGGTWSYSGENTSKADFSAFTKTGKYVLAVPTLGTSYPFEIAAKVYEAMGKAALKTFYYQRTALELTPEYAGKFARKAGHPDTEVIVHGSAKSAKRPEGTKISSSKGWYDAGDYNKYIVNSGISTYTLLAAYEHYPAYFASLKVNIPESGNQVPDILDEALWNLRWMLTMQDEDGGVYHKLTNPNFDAFVMPDMATNPRYVVIKTTAATFDFAAVMAQSARIFANFKTQFPGFSDTCLKASQKAYEWGKKNPLIAYKQDEISKAYPPVIVTGAYDDTNLGDEYRWAALELYATTGKQDFYKDAKISPITGSFDVPNWQSVGTLGIYSLVHVRTKFPSADGKAVEKGLLTLADKLKNEALKTSAYGVPMGADNNDFVWGSNAVDANEGVLLLQAYDLTKDKSYLKAAMAALDYLLGRNATGYCFVTGFGTKSTMHPHHRPSEADGIAEPIPGFLAGGPNPGVQDKGNCPDAKYPSELPALAYLDHMCSYASNEIAINWNAPLVYLALGIEAIKSQGK